LRATVINYDDAFGQTLFANTTAKLVVGYGLSARPAALAKGVAWVGAESVQTTAQGMSATLVFGDERLPFATSIIGRHNLSNLLAVAAVLVTQGLAPAEIVVELAKLQPPAGRMACLGGHNAPLIVVDYAHTPDALANILAALRDVTRARGGRLICVFGCGGDRDPGKRPEMGRAAAEGADVVCITSDNPRREAAADILQAIAVGAPAARVIEDRALAIKQMIAEAAAEDVVLLAGKGHETEQEIRGQRYPFDDAVHAKTALAAWAANQLAGVEA
jgi:UDP-N-acetylmuramoyl-L-alanyl-D-glutamate--2,6-diaminopimelate ligase